MLAAEPTGVSVVIGKWGRGAGVYGGTARDEVFMRGSWSSSSVIVLPGVAEDGLKAARGRVAVFAMWVVRCVLLGHGYERSGPATCCQR